MLGLEAWRALLGLEAWETGLEADWGLLEVGLESGGGGTEIACCQLVQPAPDAPAAVLYLYLPSDGTKLLRPTRRCPSSLRSRSCRIVASSSPSRRRRVVAAASLLRRSLVVVASSSPRRRQVVARSSSWSGLVAGSSSPRRRQVVIGRLARKEKPPPGLPVSCRKGTW